MNFFIQLPHDVLFHMLDNHLVYFLRVTNKVLKNCIDELLSTKYKLFEHKIPLPYQLKIEYNSRMTCNATRARYMYKMKTSQLDILEYTHGKGNTRLYNLKDVILLSMENFRDIKDLYKYQNHRQQKKEDKNSIKTKLEMEKMENVFKNSITSIITYHTDPQDSTFNVL